MQCLVLAGGLGTRLGRRTADRPKAMLRVAGEPFIRHQLRLLREAGVDDVVICIGYRGEIIEDEVARHCPDGLSVRCSSDGDQLLGTAGALRLAIENGLAADQFMVLYGDSYLRIDYADVWRGIRLFQLRRVDDGVAQRARPGAEQRQRARRPSGRLSQGRRQRQPSQHALRRLRSRHSDGGRGIGLVPTGAPHDLATLYETIVVLWPAAGVRGRPAIPRDRLRVRACRARPPPHHDVAAMTLTVPERTGDASNDVWLEVPAIDVADPQLSIVIPALNEELTIADFVDWCTRACATPE